MKPTKKRQVPFKQVALNAGPDIEPHHVHHRNVVGKLINFRGLVYAPVNENGVIFLFGKVAADLNMYVETIRPGYPDCLAKRYIGKGKWEEVRIEFEFRSSDFNRHKHVPGDCDAIVCWINDWPDCPENIEIIELQVRVPQLDNPVMEEPDKVNELSEHNVDDLFQDRSVRVLYDKLHLQIMKIDSEIWRKIGQRNITYYSPERVFAYLRVQKQGLRFTLFTNGKRLTAVDSFDYERGGEKWGHLYVKCRADFKPAMRALMASHERIVKAVRRGENTCWYAEQD